MGKEGGEGLFQRCRFCGHDSALSFLEGNKQAKAMLVFILARAPLVYLEGQLETTRRRFGVMLHCGNFQHRGKDGRVMSVSQVLYNQSLCRVLFVQSLPHDITVLITTLLCLAQLTTIAAACNFETSRVLRFYGTLVRRSSWDSCGV